MGLRVETEIHDADLRPLLPNLSFKQVMASMQVMNPDSVADYLSQFNELLGVIPKAVNAARKYFPEAGLVMDVYQDPEIDDRYLVLRIRPECYDDSVIERLKKAESEFLDELAGKRGWIQLTVEF